MNIAITNAQSIINLDDIKELLDTQGLRYEGDAEYFCTAHREDNELVGCVALVGNIVKYFAIKEAFKGEGLSRSMVTEILLTAHQLGRKSLSIFTTPDKVTIFESMGFTPLTSLNRNSVLLINRPDKLQQLQDDLRKQRVSGDKIGVVVINANPFTKGHAYIAEQSASQCDWLHIFVVNDNDQEFSFVDRFAMVKQGTSHLSNITVHAGNEFIISRRTFPSYFLKKSGLVNQLHAEIDCEVFKKYIAPSLAITHRFVGSEPNCAVTNNYNGVMKQNLPPQIQVTELERLNTEGSCISASTARRQLSQTASSIVNLLPITTINYLIEKCGYALQI
ncbi:[citrate (pro-3S)-lyase] ligase [Vibrio artabrorum]|uniref:[citrate (pro-3S)-lyase] ligase n=1 Tax=Vibrio TaxID=662 RepID=UPI0021C2ED67|nr:[citrate (pro-3S)-lyase] ligase [Vibrio artabrorum]